MEKDVSSIIGQVKIELGKNEIGLTNVGLKHVGSNKILHICRAKVHSNRCELKCMPIQTCVGWSSS